MTVCTVVNEEKFQSQAVTLTLIRQWPMSNSSELFSYTTICFSFKRLEPLFFELQTLIIHSYTSKENLLILSRLSDFMTCSEHFNIQSEGSISQLWNTVGR